MWENKEAEANPPSVSSAHPAATPATKAATDFRHASTSAQSPARLGPTLHVKGEISGNEDLHIEGQVEGSVTLGGHRLTVSRNAKVTAEVVAREVIVYGNMDGDLRARDRIEIRKDGSVVGDLTTARIMIEDGAYFKGQIEIDRSGTQVGSDLDGLLARGKSKLK